MKSDNKNSVSNKIDISKLDNMISNLLFGISVKASLAGWRYLREALIAYCLCDSIRKTLVNDIYPVIMRKFNATRSSIDRDISTVIKNCHAYGNLRQLNDIFGCRIIDENYPPTNLEFIANVGARLKCAVLNGKADNYFFAQKLQFTAQYGRE